jgi:recombinational DNA repair ATPase RecF
VKFSNVRLKNFRGVAAAEVRFAPTGVTIVHGPNEAGKSTLMHAINMLFDYRDDSRHEEVRLTKPVNRDVGSEVEAQVEIGEHSFTYFKRFHKDRETLLTIHAPKADLTAQCANTNAVLAAAAQALNGARNTRDTASATANQRDAEERLRRADLEFRDEEFELVRMQERLDHIRKADASAAAAGAIVAASKITDKLRANIRAAEVDLKTQLGILSAASAQFTIKALKPFDAAVDAESLSLRAGEVRVFPVSEPVVATIAEIVELRVEPGTSAESLRQAVGDAENALTRACAKAGVGSPEQAESAWAALQDAKRTLAEGCLGNADPGSAKAILDTSASALKHAREQCEEQDHELIALRTKLALVGDKGLAEALAEAERVAFEAKDALDRLLRRAAAAKLLYETLRTEREAMRRAYVAPLREGIERLGRHVFGPTLRVEVDDNLRVVNRTVDGVTVSLEQLSTGAREQMGLLVRLAAASMVCKDGGVPLVLDDALGSTDEGRLESMGAVLRIASQDIQTIILTSAPERYVHVGAQVSVARERGQVLRYDIWIVSGAPDGAQCRNARPDPQSPRSLCQPAARRMNEG